jgi:hypothetical protein
VPDIRNIEVSHILVTCLCFFSFKSALSGYIVASPGRPSLREIVTSYYSKNTGFAHRWLVALCLRDKGDREGHGVRRWGIGQQPEHTPVPASSTARPAGQLSVPYLGPPFPGSSQDFLVVGQYRYAKTMSFSKSRAKMIRTRGPRESRACSQRVGLPCGNVSSAARTTKIRPRGVGPTRLRNIS